MKTSRRRFLIFGAILLLCWLVPACSVVLAGGGHGEDAAISETVDTAGKSGVALFLANLYNDHRLMYALLVTTVMAVLGMAVAQVTDVILRAAGAQRK